MEERSALGPVNLTVPGGGSAGSLALPLRLLDGFCLYTEDAGGAEADCRPGEAREVVRSLLWQALGYHLKAHHAAADSCAAGTLNAIRGGSVTVRHSRTRALLAVPDAIYVPCSLSGEFS